MRYRVYGISSCDTVRKACKWFDTHGIAYERVDLRKTPPTEERVAGWVEILGSRAMRNTSGGSYRALPADKKDWSDDAWLAAFVRDPMLLKRPIIERDGVAVGVGFRGSEEELFARFLD